MASKRYESRPDKEHPDILRRPRGVVCTLLSSSPDDNNILPIDIENVHVYLQSACTWTLHKNTGIEISIHPCYKIEFHAAILRGQFRGMSMLVIRKFKEPVVNPCNGVLDIEMVVQVSGRLTAHRANNDQSGLTAYFKLEANAIKRDIEHLQSEDPLYKLNRSKLGDFSC